MHLPHSAHGGQEMGSTRDSFTHTLHTELNVHNTLENAEDNTIEKSKTKQSKTDLEIISA